MKLCNVNPPKIFLAFTIILAILGPLHFHINLRIITLLIPAQNKRYDILTVNQFWENCHLNNDSECYNPVRLLFPEVI